MTHVYPLHLTEVPMRFLHLLLACVSLSAFASAQSAPSEKPAAEGFSINNIDKAADPCTDFYQYACGNWLKNTSIPADQSEWVSFVELEERNKVTLRHILEKASANDPKRSPRSPPKPWLPLNMPSSTLQWTALEAATPRTSTTR